MEEKKGRRKRKEEGRRKRKEEGKEEEGRSTKEEKAQQRRRLNECLLSSFHRTKSETEKSTCLYSHTVSNVVGPICDLEM